MRYENLPKMTNWFGCYAVDIPWGHLERHLERELEDGKLDIDPDFQRAHVWDLTKQTRFVEFVLRGGTSAQNLMLNCPNYQRGNREGPYVLVDGKQRLESVMRFLRDDIVIFGRHRRSDFTDHMPLHCRFRWHVNELKTRREVLQWYIDMNEGGVAHTSEEISKVNGLLAKEIERATHPANR